ncbi:MAG: lysine biosynthesis protein LysW [bacterium]|nr:lysine biosynthesis protein LysW [bacterium]
MKIECPDCAVEVHLSEDVRIGHVEICNNCGAEIEVTALGPIQFQVIEEEK